MAVETKPLFSPELLRKAAHTFAMPSAAEAARPRLQHWADLISSGKADTFKETALLPEFLTDVFGQLLEFEVGVSGGSEGNRIVTVDR